LIKATTTSKTTDAAATSPKTPFPPTAKKQFSSWGNGDASKRCRLHLTLLIYFYTSVASSRDRKAFSVLRRNEGVYRSTSTTSSSAGRGTLLSTDNVYAKLRKEQVTNENDNNTQSGRDRKKIEDIVLLCASKKSFSPLGKKPSETKAQSNSKLQPVKTLPTTSSFGGAPSTTFQPSGGVIVVPKSDQSPFNALPKAAKTSPKGYKSTHFQLLLQLPPLEVSRDTSLPTPSSDSSPKSSVWPFGLSCKSPTAQKRRIPSPHTKLLRHNFWDDINYHDGNISWIDIILMLSSSSSSCHQK
jgi:hypothetical protein